MGITKALEILKGIAQTEGLNLRKAKDFKRAVQAYRNNKCKIDPQLSTNIGIDLEIANSASDRNEIRQSILN